MPDTIGEVLQDGEAALKKAGVFRPRRHAELLLEKATSLDRVKLYINASHTLSVAQSREYTQLLRRRLIGEPVQYITGYAPFYGREFHVGPGVFIPRFETELLIERLIAVNNSQHNNEADTQILDLCCGTGTLGLTAALEIPGSKVTLVDNSPEAIKYTKINARDWEINDRVDIRCRDVLEKFPTNWNRKFDFILANPPYIPLKDIPNLNSDVQREPQKALTDGGMGLSFYRTWASTMYLLVKPGGTFFFEIDGYTAKYMHKIMGDHFEKILISRDIDGSERVCEGTLKI